MGELTVQLGWFGLRVGGHPALSKSKKVSLSDRLAAIQLNRLM